jgi:ectoine hydroxylase-related dioxygenase (phytanoyl-CoA dioxygenase family)
MGGTNEVCRNVLSGPQIEHFNRDGFLSIREFASKPEVEAIRRTLLSLYDGNIGFNEGAQFDALGADEVGSPKRFPQILNPGVFAPTLRKGDFYRVAAKAAQEILGSDAKFSGDIAFLKPASVGAPTPWHQDAAFRNPGYEYREVSFWLALQDTDETNGCMTFLPGSQLGPILDHGVPGDDPRVHSFECVADFDKSRAVECKLPLGGCTVHGAQTLHGTGPNTSNSVRIAYVLVFDLAPERRESSRDFPWQMQHATARAARERAWRRRGGLFIALWRRRSRIRLKHPGYMI